MVNVFQASTVKTKDKSHKTKVKKMFQGFMLFERFRVSEFQGFRLFERFRVSGF